MSYKKFSEDDIFISRVKTYPEYSFFIHSGSVYINKHPHISGSAHNDQTSSYLNAGQGHISLHELNIGEARHPDSFIKAQLTHDSYRNVFKKDVNNMYGHQLDSSQTVFPYGGTLSSLYPLSSSIYRDHLLPETLPSNHIKKQNGYKTVVERVGGIEIHPSASALKNLANYYSIMNPSLNDYDTYLDKPINIIKIPSVFYGSSMRKGSIDLKFFYTGSLASRCRDERQNGQLIADSPLAISGAVVGHVFYNEGIIIFPEKIIAANTALTSETMETSGSKTDTPRWVHFGLGLSNDNSYSDASFAPHASPSASFEINFEGTSYLNQMTLLCHADKGEMNYSNNPTYQDLTQPKIQTFNSSSFFYEESPIKIKNVASSSFYKGEDDFRKVTYITKVGIYDEYDQLIMTVDLARPYKKEEMNDYTFKVKYDLL
jgi:hypothetical protein